VMNLRLAKVSQAKLYAEKLNLKTTTPNGHEIYLYEKQV
jgi:hypothetical protein